MNILFIGGAGFIGSAVIRHIIQHTKNSVLNLDKLTYAGSLESLVEISQNPRYQFQQVDICDASKLEQVFQKKTLFLLILYFLKQKLRTRFLHAILISIL